MIVLSQLLFFLIPLIICSTFSSQRAVFIDSTKIYILYLEAVWKMRMGRGQPLYPNITFILIGETQRKENNLR